MSASLVGSEMCIRDSFWVVPVVAYICGRLRPDLHVEVPQESAGSMREAHRAAIAEALGLQAGDSRIWTIDTTAWSAFPRGRLFFSRLP
eukprot:6711224-Alexandrium_andersonii.AAC.1